MSQRRGLDAQGWSRAVEVADVARSRVPQGELPRVPGGVAEGREAETFGVPSEFVTWMADFENDRV